MVGERTQTEGQPSRRVDPDAEFARSFAIGCGVIVIVFLCGWATIAFFWLR